MIFFRQIIEFLVYSNSWIGLGAAAMTWQFYLVTDLHVRYDIIAFNFFATVLTYTFQRYIKQQNNTHGKGDRLDWMNKYSRLVIVIMTLSAVGTIGSVIRFSFESFILLFFCGLLSFFYVVKVPLGKGKSLRDIPSIKIYLIAAVWGLTTTFLPYYNIGSESNDLPLMNFAAHFIFIVAITIPFDIRDVHLDEDEKKTIPQLIGVRNATILAVVLLIGNYFIVRDVPFWSLSIPHTAFLIMAIAFVWAAQYKKRDIYFTFWIDGLIVMQTACFFIEDVV